MSPATPRLILAGPMGAGKTTVGRLLAGWLGGRFEDLDERIVRREGASVVELFARGEESFRQAERECARAWLEESGGDGRPAILALGGGALEDPALAESLCGGGTVVHLDGAAEVLAARLAGKERASRPLIAAEADPVARLEELRRRRAAGYARAALRVDTGGLDLAGAALALLRALYRPAVGPWAEEPRRLGEGVFAGRGACRIGAAPRAMVLWDEALPPAHETQLAALVESLGVEPVVRRLPAGETVKCVERLAELWEAMQRAGLDRDAALIVAGGGTLTDLGGFAAHGYKRGIALHLLPTTLLGQLDAALGGKNGINFGGTKNAVGTIRLPDSVQIDPLFLLSLPPGELRGGLAEAVKSGLIGDAGLFELLESPSAAALGPDGAQAGSERARAQGPGSADHAPGSAASVAPSLPLLEEIARRSAAVKLAVVGEDLHEAGRRRELNLGHTLGHALESAAAARGERLSHGEAVAIGMAFAARLSAACGELADGELPERIESALAAAGLPVARPAWAAGADGELLEIVGRDKKRRGGENVWVLPRRAGEVCCRPVAAEEVRRALGGW